MFYQFFLSYADAYVECALYFDGTNSCATFPEMASVVKLKILLKLVWFVDEPCAFLLWLGAWHKVN